MSELEELGRRAIDDPIRTPPPVASLVSTATRRRQRHRVAVGLVGAVVLIAGIGAAVSLGGGGQGSSQIDVAGPVASAEAGASSTTTTTDTKPTTGDPSPDPGPVEGAASPLDAAGLIAELDLRGALVTEVPDDASSPFFTGSSRSLCVNGRLVRLFEYGSIDERRVESDQITSDGQPNDRTFVSWTGSPRFFAAGNLIALHLSADVETLTLLAEILGPTLSPDGIGLRGSGDPPCGADFLNDPQVEATPPLNPEQPAPSLTAETAEDAEALLTGFIDALGRGDTAGARQMWTGYPFSETQVSREFEQFLDDFAWLATAEDPQLLVVPSFAFVEAAPVVTVVSSETYGKAPSFVLSLPQDGEPQMIERLPTIGLPPNPPLSAVKPGEILAFDVFPIEGSARAFLDEQEIGVAVDWELGTVNVLLPDELPPTFTITVTFATPETPGAFAVAYSSSSGD